MFLVGIAGSLLPFLFLLGVVFVFSVQTSTQSLDDALYFDDNEALSHQIYHPSALESDAETDFRFSQAYADNIDCTKAQMSGMLCMMPRTVEADTSGTILQIPGVLVADGQYLFCFSGLSPPRCC